MIEGDSLTADGHILSLVTVSVGNNLVVVGVFLPVEVEKVFHHFGEVIIQLENIVRSEIRSDSVLSLFQY